MADIASAGQYGNVKILQPSCVTGRLPGKRVGVSSTASSLTGSRLVGDGMTSTSWTMLEGLDIRLLSKSAWEWAYISKNSQLSQTAVSQLPQ